MSANARVIIEYESGVRAVGPILRLEGQGIQVGLTSDALEGPVTVWLPGSGSLGSIRFASFARAKGNSVFLSTDRLGARGRQRLRELQERAAAGELSEMRSPPGTSADSDERARSRTPIPRAGGVVERVRRPATSEPDEKAAPAAAAVRREHSTAPAAVNRMPSAAPAAAPVRPPESETPAPAARRERARRPTPAKGIVERPRAEKKKRGADSGGRAKGPKRPAAIEVRLSTVPAVQCDVDLVRRALAGPSRMVDLKGVEQRAGRPVLIELESGGRLIIVEGEVQSRRGSSCRLRLQPTGALADTAG